MTKDPALSKNGVGGLCRAWTEIGIQFALARAIPGLRIRDDQAKGLCLANEEPPAIRYSKTLSSSRRT